jgi:hypothetical protein
MFDRDKAIECLTDDDINTVLHDDYGPEYLHGILYSGFKGYQNYTDEQLMQEMTERDISYLFGEIDG